MLMNVNKNKLMTRQLSEREGRMTIIRFSDGGKGSIGPPLTLTHSHKSFIFHTVIKRHDESRYILHS